MPSIAERSILMVGNRYDVTRNDIRLAAADAERVGIPAVMLMPSQLEVFKADGRKVSAIAACGYPSGCQPAENKALEIEQAVALGADAVWLMPLCADTIDGRTDAAERELRLARKATDKPVTLVVEWAVFEPQQALALCRSALQCGITSFATSAAFAFNSVFSVTDPLALAQLVCTTEPDTVRAMREALGAEVEIIACEAGLEKNKADALLAAGADRVAASNILDIL